MAHPSPTTPISLISDGPLGTANPLSPPAQHRPARLTSPTLCWCVCLPTPRVQLSSSYASLRQAANEFSYFPASGVGIVAHGVARLAAALKVRHTPGARTTPGHGRLRMYGAIYEYIYINHTRWERMICRVTVQGRVIKVWFLTRQCCWTSELVCWRSPSSPLHLCAPNRRVLVRCARVATTGVTRLPSVPPCGGLHCLAGRGWV